MRRIVSPIMPPQAPNWIDVETVNKGSRGVTRPSERSVAAGMYDKGDRLATSCAEGRRRIPRMLANVQGDAKIIFIEIIIAIPVFRSLLRF